MSAEDDTCTSYERSQTSFVWGGGLNGTANLTTWIEGELEPYLRSVGVDPERDFAAVPYYIEHRRASRCVHGLSKQLA